MQRDIDRILLTRGEIATRVASLADELMADIGIVSEGEEIVLVPVLTGSIIFVADLIRHLPVKVRLDVITASSYPGKATASQGVSIAGKLPDDLTARHVIIVDDILDSGRTITAIRGEISKRGPASVRACVLLSKNLPSADSVVCEYVGFDIPDEFVVGYGLDYDGYYRNLPDIGVLKPDAL